MTINQSVCDVINALAGIQNMHCTEMGIAWLDADNLFCNLYCIGIFRIQSCDKRICLTCFNHHHAEIVTLKHLIVGLLKCTTLTLTLFCHYLCIAFSSLALIVMSQVYYFYSVKTELQFLGKFLYSFVVT